MTLGRRDRRTANDAGAPSERGRIGDHQRATISAWALLDVEGGQLLTTILATGYDQWPRSSSLEAAGWGPGGGLLVGLYSALGWSVAVGVLIVGR